MGNQLLINPYPYGRSNDQIFEIIEGSVAMYGSAVSTGEPLNWANVLSGIGYNEINFAGNGIHGQQTAQTTGFAVSAGTATVTAANNFFVGQQVTFVGNTQTLSALFNGQTYTIVTASSTNFTIVTTNTGTTTTSDVGLAIGLINPGPFRPLAPPPPSLTATVSALSASGTTLTVTAANTFLPGAQVLVSVATGTLGPKLTMYLPVIQSTGTAFTATMPSALTGTTGTGTVTGINPIVPFTVQFWSALNSGYVYQYNGTFGTLFVDAQTNAAAAGDPLAKLAAAAYPAGVLNDVIKFRAKYARG